MRASSVVIIILLVVMQRAAYAQDSAWSDNINRKRLNTLVVGSTVTYVGSLAALSHLWYKDAERQSFRFFNDNAEWKQVDKIGHMYSSFYLSYGTSRALQWTGIRPTKSDLYGSLVGFAVLLPIEIFDGYSAAYGASAGDLLANFSGSALYLGQQKLWKEIRIYPRLSFHRTSFAKQRPDVLGDNLASEILKDYNGQTYWLSFDLDKFMNMPRWLNVSIGYGAENMIYGRDYQNAEAGLRPIRQWYFSIEPDLSAIKTRSRAVKTLLFIANMIKIPGPTLELSRQSKKFHPLYF